MQANPAWPDRERLLTSARKRRCSTALPARAISRRSSPTPRPLQASAWPCWRPPGRRKGRGGSQGAGREGLGRVCDPRQPRSRLSSSSVGSLLTETDHKRRLDRLLLNDSRWDRRAQRTRRRHPPGHPTAVRARAEEGRGAPRRVPARQELRTAARPSCRRTRSRPSGALPCRGPKRCAGRRKHEEAWKILLAEPESTLHVKPDGWWEERRASAYAALKAGKPKTGLRTGARSRPALGQRAERTRRSWPAGWRCATCNDAKQALGHFRRWHEIGRRSFEPARAAITGSAAPTRRWATRPRPRRATVPRLPTSTPSTASWRA